VKVLWISNAPWAPSGYGSQTRQVGLRVAKAGYEIEFVANDGTRGDQQWNDLLVRGSSGVDRYSRDSIMEDFQRSEADWVISLYDAWVYTQGMKDPFEDMPRMAGWIPIDHFPVPHALYGWLSNNHMAIAMSRFGFDRLTELSSGFKSIGRRPFEVRYAPHAVDDVFRPVETDFRDTIDVPDDAFLIGIVAANTDTLNYDRKGFSDMACALSEFMGRHSDVYLYLHTVQTAFGSMDLPALLAATVMPDDRLRWVDQYALKKHTINDEHMAQIYSSFDLLCATSRGEGFGLPVIEAQACGVPVIASNWTAQAELIGDTWDGGKRGNQEHPSGWLVKVDPDWDPKQGAFWGKPSIDAIVVGLERAYETWRKGGWQERRDAAVAKAEGWRADAVFEKHWKPLLAEMAAGVRQEPISLNRQQRRRQKLAVAR
jgi:glycosyltransferase involved in cell wall biosynthesis